DEGPLLVLLSAVALNQSADYHVEHFAERGVAGLVYLPVGGTSVSNLLQLDEMLVDPMPSAARLAIIGDNPAALSDMHRLSSSVEWRFVVVVRFDGFYKITWAVVSPERELGTTVVRHNWLGAAAEESPAAATIYGALKASISKS